MMPHLTTEIYEVQCFTLEHGGPPETRCCKEPLTVLCFEAPYIGLGEKKRLGSDKRADSDTKPPKCPPSSPCLHIES